MMAPPTKRRWLVALVLILLPLNHSRADSNVAPIPPGPPSNQAGDSPNRIVLSPSADEVDAAMKKAVAYLLRLKQAGNFEHSQQLWWDKSPETGGVTALTAYALLHAGKSMSDGRLAPKSPELKPVLDYLGALKQDGTYAAGLTALALHFLPRTAQAKSQFNNCKSYLLRGVNTDPGNPQNQGGYGYVTTLTALEALPIAERRLAEVKQLIADAKAKNTDPNALHQLETETLKLAQDAVNQYRGIAASAPKSLLYSDVDASNSQYGVLGAWALQDSGIEIKNGYWKQVDSYWRRTQQPDGGWKYQNKPDYKNSSDTMSVAGLASLYITSSALSHDVSLTPRPDPEIDRALAKVIADFHPSGDEIYYMYGVERVGLASGLKFFGTRNWYREGAAALLKSQGDDGSWQRYDNNIYVSHPTAATPFGLLFLARGRNPVPFNKLQYDGPWNARQNDEANLVDWMGRQYEKEFNWQVVNTQVEPEEWMDSPILLITGSKSVEFSPAVQAKIKKFVEMGGMIFSTSDGASPAFDHSMRALMARLFPDYPAAPLKHDSPLLNGELQTEPIANPPLVFAISNGVRVLWVHTPEDFGASWQKRAYTKVSHFVFPLNLYFYAESLSTSRSKLDDLVVHVGSLPTKNQINVTTLLLGSNPEPEPFAWSRMAQIAKADLLMNCTVSRCPAAELPAKKPQLVALTGTAAFSPSSQEVAALQAYIRGGGTILADAAAGNKDFTHSFILLAKAMYPDGTLEDITLADPMFNGSNGSTISAVEFRRYTKKLHGRSGDWTSLRLRGIKIAGRWAVIFSEYDLTSGLLGTNTWGIDGYTARSSESIVKDVLTYTLHQTEKK